MDQMKKKALVAGGSGFLGSHLCERLLNLNYKIVCLDNCYTGFYENIAHLENNEDFEFVDHDICLPYNIEVDEIFNLACPASPKHYQKDPIYTMKISVVGTLNMLNLAVNQNAKFFHSSTSEVYGDPIIHPQKESYWGNVNPIGIRSCYDEGKRAAETLIFDVYRKYNSHLRVGRIFNTYGPKMHADDGRVVSNFIVQALLGKPITIYGDGSQTRSFCYVDDLIDAIILVMNSDQEKMSPINIGNDKEFSVKQLAEFVLEKVKSKSKIVYNDLPQDDPEKRKPDLTLAKKILNWSPKIDIEKGLDKTIKYFRENL
jgi:UDP-glucuronate decarboxylase